MPLTVVVQEGLLALAVHESVEPEPQITSAPPITSPPSTSTPVLRPSASSGAEGKGPQLAPVPAPQIIDERRRSITIDESSNVVQVYR